MFIVPLIALRFWILTYLHSVTLFTWFPPSAIDPLCSLLRWLLDRAAQMGGDYSSSHRLTQRFLTFSLSHLLVTPSTVALTGATSSTSIQRTDLCSCSKAWTERRLHGIIFQLLPQSWVSPVGSGTVCTAHVIYWWRVKLLEVRQHSTVCHGGVDNKN